MTTDKSDIREQVQVKFLDTYEGLALNASIRLVM